MARRISERVPNQHHNKADDSGAPRILPMQTSPNASCRMQHSVGLEIGRHVEQRFAEGPLGKPS